MTRRKRHAIGHTISMAVLFAILIIGGWVAVMLTDVLIHAVGLGQGWGGWVWLVILAVWMLRATYREGLKAADREK